MLWCLPQYYFDIETVPLDEYRNDAGASFYLLGQKSSPYSVRGLKLRWERAAMTLGLLIWKYDNFRTLAKIRAKIRLPDNHAAADFFRFWFRG